MAGSEKERLVDTDGTRVYPTRWYVLIMVCLANILNNLFWASWGPISQSTELVYGWSDKTLFWVVNIGNITGFIFTLLGSYLVDRKGIRVATVICSALMTVTGTSRIITTSQPAATILLSVGTFFNGIATAIGMTLPPVVAEVWFHVSERTTATAICMFSECIGVSVAYLFGPYLVPMPKMNGTTILLNETNIERIEQQMNLYNYINFGVSLGLFVCVLLYLPDKPPSAPSLSSKTTRYSFWVGVNKLIRKPNMWLIAVACSIVGGFNGNFISMLDVILSPKGISQKEAGLMSFYASIGGVVLGLITSRVADRFKYKMKPLIFLNYTVSAALVLWFSLMVDGFLTSWTAGYYVSVILSYTLLTTSMPLFMEITCETAYPIGEGVTGGFLCMMSNLGAAVVLAFSQIQRLGVSWMSWSLFGSLVVSLPLLVVLRAQYQRVDIDTGHGTDIDSRRKTGIKRAPVLYDA